MLNTWSMHQKRFIQTHPKALTSSQKCGLLNGGRSYRYEHFVVQSRISIFWTPIWSKLPSHATIAPVILATDKTHLTQFSGNKTAYPVYLTIGNLPKGIRRKPSKNACILIAYLSVDKLNRSEMKELEHRSHVQRIFHESMKTVLEPLKKAGREGVLMTSSNGDVRQVHPIITCYVADYPEQCLVTCTKYGTCIKCQRSADDLQNPKPGNPRTSFISYIRAYSSTLLDGVRAFLVRRNLISEYDVFHQAMESDTSKIEYLLSPRYLAQSTRTWPRSFWAAWLMLWLLLVLKPLNPCSISSTLLSIRPTASE